MDQELSEIDIFELQKDFIDLTFFLPWDYKLSADSDYFLELIGIVHHNTEKQPHVGSVHFALMAMHMIFMGIVYNYISILYAASPKKFNNVFIGFHHDLEKGNEEFSWHKLSNINERTIFEFFRYVGIEKPDICNLKKLVDGRNDLSHTNGVYVGDFQEFSQQSQKYLRGADIINQACFHEIKKMYFRFIRSVKVKLVDQEEAVQYLREYFFREYNIGSKIVDKLSDIGLRDYPRTTNSKKFHSGLKKYTEEWSGPSTDLISWR